jgi:hypothetical protein
VFPKDDQRAVNELPSDDPSDLKIAFAQRRQWQDFVDSHAASTPLHCVPWLEVLEQAYAMRLRIPTLMKHDTVVAGVPFLETRRPFAQRQVVATPFSDWMTPLAVSPRHLTVYAKKLAPLLAAEYQRAVVHTDRPVGGFPVVQTRIRHVLDVNQSYEKIADSFSRGLKDNLRQAGNADLSYRASQEESALAQFCQLNVRARRARGIPSQPHAFFSWFSENILQHNLGFVGVVRHQGQSVAAGLFIQFNHITIAKCLASDSAALSLRPNDWLLSCVIRDLAEAATNWFDFGATEIGNRGLRHFKNKWGAREVPVYSEHLVGAPSTTNASLFSKSLRGMASTVIRMAPQSCAPLLGKLIYGYSSGNSW